MLSVSYSSRSILYSILLTLLILLLVVVLMMKLLFELVISWNNVVYFSSEDEEDGYELREEYKSPVIPLKIPR